MGSCNGDIEGAHHLESRSDIDKSLGSRPYSESLAEEVNRASSDVSNNAMHNFAEQDNVIKAMQDPFINVQPSDRDGILDSSDTNSDDGEDSDISDGDTLSNDEDDVSLSEDERYTMEKTLTDEEVEKLVDELLQVESEAAEAQETLEEETLEKIKESVLRELSEVLSSSELDAAVEEEMATFIAQWEDVLAVLDDRSSILQEQLEDAGVDLPSIFKSIEKQAPEGCLTEAWKKRTHWAGVEASEGVAQVIRKAETELELQNPVQSRRGKLVEEGASGFLAKKIGHSSPGGEWSLLSQVGEGVPEWATVYAASTPEQAARLGLKFPGANEVEEIGDVQGASEVAALAEESAHGLTENQRTSIKRVREEDDVKKLKKIQQLPVSNRRKTHRRYKQKAAEGKKDVLPSFGNKIVTEEVKKDVSKPIIDEIVADADNLKEDVMDLMGKRKALARPDAACLIQVKQETSRNSDDGGHMQASPESVPRLREDVIVLSDDDVYEESLRKRKRLSVKCNYNPTNVKENSSDSSRSDKGNGFRIEAVPKRVAPSGRKRPKVLVIDSEDEKETRRNTETDELPSKEHYSVPSSDSDDEEVLNQNKRLRRKRCSRKFKCTVCDKSLTSMEVLRHPSLEAIICNDCKKRYESDPFLKDEDGSEAECRWCGEGGEMICCDFCDKVFCQKCIISRFGEEEVETIIYSKEWRCFICDPSPLEKYKLLLQEAEEDTNEQKDYTSVRKGKHRRNIRKVMDDDGLSEQTKYKLLLEKERQERLDQWYKNAREKGPSKRTESSSNPQQDNENDHLCADDCATLGCTVNIAHKAHEEPAIHIPLSISREMKPHQLAGVRFMWDNCIESIKKAKSGGQGLGCILAHSMGLGKTMQVIAFLYTVMTIEELALRTVLIVVPVNVLHNWKYEFDKWRPKEVKRIRVFMLDDYRENNKRAELLRHWKENGGVMLIGYAAFRTLANGKHVKDKEVRDAFCQCLQNPGPDILVCDEAHTIKNRKADITHVLKQVRTQRRIALTGSPLQNNLMEYYCMVDFVREGFLGGAADFRNRFQNPIENGQHADSTAQDVRKMKHRAHVLHKQLRGFVQRKDMTVLKHDLPPKCVWVISVKLSPLQRELYKSFLEVYNQSKIDGTASKKNFLFYSYHCLAKIWNHPDILWRSKEEKEDLLEDFIVDSDDDIESDEETAGGKGDKKGGKTKADDAEVDDDRWWIDIHDGGERDIIDHSGKMVILLQLLRMSSSRGDKVLIFSQSLHTLDIIECFLENVPRNFKPGCWKKNREWYRLDGQTSAMSRQKLVQQFNDPANSDVQCVLISTRAGSLGINLPAANRVIIVDGSWNPTHDLQALFRAWRFGQTKPVYAYRLLAYGTMEEKIYNRQLTKEGVAARVLDEHQVGRHLTADDLELLFTLDDDSTESPKGEASGASNSDMPGPSQKTKHSVMFSAPEDAPPRDELMAMLLLDLRPRWIAKYHEHEPLLEDLEEEKLTKEEESQAWEAFHQQQQQEQHQQFQQEIYQQNANKLTCDVNQHIKLLYSMKIAMGASILCPVCKQMFGWEQITRRPRAGP